MNLWHRLGRAEVFFEERDRRERGTEIVLLPPGAEPPDDPRVMVVQLSFDPSGSDDKSLAFGVARPWKLADLSDEDLNRVGAELAEQTGEKWEPSPKRSKRSRVPVGASAAAVLGEGPSQPAAEPVPVLVAQERPAEPASAPSKPRRQPLPVRKVRRWYDGGAWMGDVPSPFVD